MARLLYIESSPRKDRSSSIQVAQAYIEAYKKSHPEDMVDILDLWKTELPAFDGDVINAKYAILHGEQHSEVQKKAWEAVEEVIANFKTADQYLISLPMWNFGIPYRLKHFIDVLVQPGYTFSFSPDEGYKGLVTGKQAVLVYARGGAYGPGTGAEAMDYQKSYMEQILKFIGFTDIHPVLIEPTIMVSPDEKTKIVKAAIEEAQKIASL
ncbi:FMN-dependent NADH-azoreductase [bacterium]|nr:MAG: FMN-dependent NADH-azoreductase [bacterium]